MRALVLAFLSIYLVNGKLIATQIFVRHGQRFPTSFLNFPSENQSTIVDSIERGELTTVGIQQEYQLGKNIRDYYNDLAGPEYRSSTLKVLAGSDNRTIASALALLAGLYPPSKRQTWNANLPWLPIPVHTEPILDMVSYGALDYCPGFTQTLVNSTDSVTFFRNNINIVHKLENLTGLPIFDVDRLQKVIDAILTRQDIPDLLPLPGWALQPDLTKQLRQLRNQVHIQFINQLLSSSGGWHFKLITDEFDQILKGSTKHKLAIYSAHDSNIMTLGMLLHMSVVDSQLQTYASYLAFDLSQEENATIVRAFLHDKLNGTRTQLGIRDCAEPCNYDQFKRLATPVGHTQFYSACLGEDIEVGSERMTLYGIIASLMVLAVILLGAVTVLLFLSKRHWKRRYHHLAKEERRPLLVQTP